MPDLPPAVRQNAQRVLDGAARRLLEEDADDHAGMTPADEWAQTEIHKVSRYGCGKCGEMFETPHEFYDHLDEVHAEESK